MTSTVSDMVLGVRVFPYADKVETTVIIVSCTSTSHGPSGNLAYSVLGIGRCQGWRRTLHLA